MDTMAHFRAKNLVSSPKCSRIAAAESPCTSYTRPVIFKSLSRCLSRRLSNSRGSWAATNFWALAVTAGNALGERMAGASHGLRL